MLEARSLTKYYAAIPAIRDVSFRLSPGGILGLLGPNGSGKSTTVSILTGLLEPSGGTVVLDGTPVRDDLLGYKARVGYYPKRPCCTPISPAPSTCRSSAACAASPRGA
jgi:ABC-2 type transport system ATP-binding protein